MEPSNTLFWVILGIGWIFSQLLTWFVARQRFVSRYVPREELDSHYVQKQQYVQLERQADVLRDDLHEKQETINEHIALTAQLKQQLDQERDTIATLQQQFQLQFEKVANQLLEEKGARFTQMHEKQLDQLLKPLRENILRFEQEAKQRFHRESEQRISIRKEMEHLRSLNQQLSRDAVNLADALKGDAKIQGDWGEWQLERLLEKAGLVRDLHFKVQASFADDSGQQKRPDFIISLPDEKHLIIDCKVSLVAFERFYSTVEEGEGREQHLKAHLNSLRQHVKSLSRKSYEQLYEINSPDYVLLFVPLEPAFLLAIQQDPTLFEYALEKNVVLVGASTLLATMRTVSFIWKQENQKRNVLEIAYQSGLLYDKFCAFVEDLQGIGHRLDQAHSSWGAAMNKLKESTKYGDTLVGRAEKIRELGAKASKQLPPDLLESAREASPSQSDNT